MSLTVGLVGDLGAGKTTLFDALAAAPGGEHSASGPGGTMVRSLQVIDPRLDLLAEVFQPKKVTPVSIRVVDFQGGSGKSDARIAALRETDAFLLVVRAFAFGDDPVPDPAAGERAVLDEWLLYDMETVDRRLERLARSLRTVRAKELTPEKREQELLLRLKEALEQGIPIREVSLGPEEETALRGFQFLSQKPYHVVWNLGEGREPPPVTDGPEPLRVRAQVEKEIAELGDEERAVFLEEMGIDRPAWERVPADCLATLGVVTFYTVVGTEVRAWTLREGGTAVAAAGCIHEDMARNFIRAEVLPFADFAEEKGPPREKRKGHLEGKDYVVRDGDILTIRFGR